jgi:hypothetical protein
VVGREAVEGEQVLLGLFQQHPGRWRASSVGVADVLGAGVGSILINTFRKLVERDFMLFCRTFSDLTVTP